MAYTAKLMWIPGQRLPIDACGCHFCDNEWRRTVHELDPEYRQSWAGMIVCPDCGNKRCPKASYHGGGVHSCTGSNTPGQPGSVYGDFEIDTSWMDDDDD